VPGVLLSDRSIRLDGWGSSWIPLAAFGLWVAVMSIYLSRAVDRPVEPDYAEQQVDVI
jgi:hypothetical protein